MRKQRYEHYAILQLKAVVAYLREQGYSGFRPKLNFIWDRKWSTDKACHYCEKNGKDIVIYLAMSNLWDHELNWEYREYADDPEIGAFKHESKKVRLRAVLAHELAHGLAMQFYDDFTHGSKWQEIYRDLRKEFVNYLVSDSHIEDGLNEIEFDMEMED